MEAVRARLPELNNYLQQLCSSIVLALSRCEQQQLDEQHGQIKKEVTDDAWLILLTDIKQVIFKDLAHADTSIKSLNEFSLTEGQQALVQLMVMAVDEFDMDGVATVIANSQWSQVSGDNG